MSAPALPRTPSRRAPPHLLFHGGRGIRVPQPAPTGEGSQHREHCAEAGEGVDIDPSPKHPPAHRPQIPTLTVDVPAAAQVPHDLAAGQVAVEVLGRGGTLEDPLRLRTTAPRPS